MCLIFLRPRSSTILNHHCNSGLDSLLHLEETKSLLKATQGRMVSLWLTIYECSASCQGSQGIRSVRQSVPWPLRLGSRERWMLALHTLSLFIQFQTPALGILPSIFRVGLFSSVKTLWKPHRHTQGHGSMVI